MTLNILLHTKAVPKVIDIWFCIPIIFKNPIKPGSSIINILFTIFVVRVRIITGYSLFQKQKDNIISTIKDYWCTNSYCTVHLSLKKTASSVFSSCVKDEQFSLGCTSFCLVLTKLSQKPSQEIQKSKSILYTFHNSIKVFFFEY